MIVEPYGYPIENRLVRKIDLMIERCGGKVKRDAVLLIEGAEGEGKTTCSLGIAMYAAQKLGREFTHKNVFFSVEPMIEFLQSTSDQIAIWDEPALQALNTDFAKTAVKDITRLLMMVRKKRHFIIINMTHFNKFNDYIVCDRPLGMIHVYSRKGTEPGRFIYIRKKYLHNLWLDFRFKKQKNYVKYCSMSGKIRGSFPDVVNPKYKNNINEDFDVAAYEREKDKAIMMVGKKDKKKDKNYDDLKRFKQTLASVRFPLTSKEQLAEQLGVNVRQIYRWAHIEGGIHNDKDISDLNNNKGVMADYQK